MGEGAPDVEEVVRVASSLGITLRPSDAIDYHEQVLSALRVVEEFMDGDTEDGRPPVLYPDRSKGYRPSELEDRLNAWLWKCEIKGADDGPLAGKTVSFKDHIAVAGVPLTLGARAMEGYIPDFDATIVTRVLAAGGTVIGKNTMNGPTSDWGFGLPSDYDRPRNPQAPDHWTGGSSSGSAAAVAAGQVDISFGGDQGGSIRVPAAYCGVYGLKPTFGLVSHFGIGFGSDPSLDYVGPMARYVEDVAVALDSVAGYDPYDPRQDRTVPLSTKTLGSLGHGVKGVRIGILEEGFVDADPEVCDSVMDAVDVLVRAGAEATKISIPRHLNAGVPQYVIFSQGARAIFDVGFFGAFAKTYYPARWIEMTHKLFHEHTDALVPRGKLNLIVSEFARRRFHGTAYAKAQNVRAVFKSAYDEALDHVDVIAMPTCLGLAPKYSAPEYHLERAFQARRWSRNTNPFDLTGHPALSVPCGKFNGLPIGMQLVGRNYAESVLLSTAYAYQHAVDWDRMIAISADPSTPSSGHAAA